MCCNGNFITNLPVGYALSDKITQEELDQIFAPMPETIPYWDLKCEQDLAACTEICTAFIPTIAFATLMILFGTSENIAFMIIAFTVCPISWFVMSRLYIFARMHPRLKKRSNAIKEHLENIAEKLNFKERYLQFNYDWAPGFHGIPAYWIEVTWAGKPQLEEPKPDLENP